MVLRLENFVNFVVGVRVAATNMTSCSVSGGLPLTFFWNKDVEIENVTSRLKSLYGSNNQWGNYFPRH